MTEAKIGLVGIPFDGNSSYATGAAAAPSAIRTAFTCDASNTWNEAMQDVAAHLVDLGDATLSDATDQDDGVRCVLDRYPDVEQFVFLGGDHSVTYPILRAMAPRFPNLTLIHFDAHPDLYPEFNGNRYSHACPMMRIMEAGLAQRIIQVGIRTMNDVQLEQARRFNAEVIAMKDWPRALPTITGPAYLTFDMDVLDPAFAPGVSHREPGGMNVREAMWAISELSGWLVAADIVELNPQRDPGGLSATVAAKMLKEIAGRMLRHF